MSQIKAQGSLLGQGILPQKNRSYLHQHLRISLIFLTLFCQFFGIISPIISAATQNTTINSSTNLNTTKNTSSVQYAVPPKTYTYVRTNLVIDDSWIGTLVSFTKKPPVTKALTGSIQTIPETTVLTTSNIIHTTNTQWIEDWNTSMNQINGSSNNEFNAAPLLESMQNAFSSIFDTIFERLTTDESNINTLSSSLSKTNATLNATNNTLNTNITNTNTRVENLSGSLSITNNDIASLSGALATTNIRMLSLGGGGATYYVQNPLTFSSGFTQIGNTVSFTPGANGEVLTMSGDVAVWLSPATVSIPVLSVFGRTGSILAQSGDYNTSMITEGTNLYYTQARFDAAFGLKSTTDLVEGTNLYFTNVRAQNALSGTVAGLTGSIATLSGNLSTTNSNLATATGNITTLTTNLSSLSGTVSTTETNITSLSGGLATTNSNLSSLSGSLSTTNSNLSALSGTVSTLSGVVATKESLLSFNNGLTRVGNTIGLTTGTNGEVLTMSGGIPVWLSLVISSWSPSGNVGTNPLTQFIGTTDNTDLVFKRNNVEAFRLSGASGNLVTTADATINGIKIGRGSGNISTNTAVGYTALTSNTIGYNNTANGMGSLFSNTSGTNNIGLGVNSIQYNQTGNRNIGIGNGVMSWGNQGDGNIGIGVSAGYGVVGAIGNVIMGDSAFYPYGSAGAGATNNVIIGKSAGQNLDGSSSGNIIIGANAVAGLCCVNYLKGANNIFIGSGVQPTAYNLSNQLNIGNWIYGSEGNIGIGITNPAEKLVVSGNIKADRFFLKKSRINFSTGTSNDWFRIATLPGYGIAGEYYVKWKIQGYTRRDVSSVISVSCGASRWNCTFSSEGDNSASIKGYRIVSSGFYSDAYVEIQLGWDTSSGMYPNYYDFSLLDTNASNIDNALYTVISTGSIPGGYSVTNTQNIFHISSTNGSIGIGTSAPNYKLEVQGDINAIGTVRANSIALTSDARFKQGVTTILNSVDIISRLNPVSYTWNLLGQQHGGKLNSTEYGFLAQDVELILPGAVSTSADGYKSLNYIDFIPHLVGAMKQIIVTESIFSGSISIINTRIDTLTTAVDSITSSYTTILTNLANIRNTLNTQSLTLAQMQGTVLGLQSQIDTINQNNSGTEALVVNNYFTTITQTGSINTGSVTNLGTTISDEIQNNQNILIWTHSGELLSQLTGSGMSGSIYTGVLIAPRYAYYYISDLFTTSTDVIHDFISLQITAVHGYFDQIWTAKITTKELVASGAIIEQFHTNTLCIKKSNGTDICLTGDQLEMILASVPVPASVISSTPGIPQENTDSGPILPVVDTETGTIDSGSIVPVVVSENVSDTGSALPEGTTDSGSMN